MEFHFEFYFMNFDSMCLLFSSFVSFLKCYFPFFIPINTIYYSVERKPQMFIAIWILRYGAAHHDLFCFRIFLSSFGILFQS